MIEVRDLSRSYGGLRAVSGVSFDIGPGEIVGLLGHNGAGKTTIMKMLTGYLEPSAGSIRIDGLALATQRREAQRRIGYLPENCPLYPEMTVLESLEYQAVLHGLPAARRPAAIRQAVTRTALESKASAPVGTLSRGYRQRLGVAQAILHNPKILILDEPTNGLDPAQIQHMRELIRELARDATVIISTHILQEVEAICARVLIMRGGRLALDSELHAIGQNPRLLVTLERPAAEAQGLLTTLPGVSAVTVLEPAAGDRAAGDQAPGRQVFALTVADARAAAPAVARAIAGKGWDLFGLEPERRDLEDLFRAISTAGEGAGEGAEGAVDTALETAHV